MTFLLFHKQESSSANRFFHHFTGYPSLVETTDEIDSTSKRDQSTLAQQSSSEQWTGVAATLALRSPKWFHRRYTAMIHNILLNTPDTIIIQIFVNPPWWKEEIHKFHRGMSLLEQHPRVNITELPRHLSILTKPKMIMTNRFIWEQLLHDRVFFFSGNGVRCANSFASWEAFDGIDFLGVPSKRYKGGDVLKHSIRSRQAMLDVIDFKGDAGDTAETHYFSTGLEELEIKTPGKYRFGTTQEQALFGGGSQLVTYNGTLVKDPEQVGPSFVMSGIEESIPWLVREHLLMLCPEWKVIFPSLHEPSCFGAHPDSNKCAATLCALKADRPKSGC